MVTVIETTEEFQEAIAQDKLVIVDFFATWCGPCKMIAPLLEKFATQYPDAAFYKVDVDNLGSVAQEQEVSAMPTIKFYKKSSVVKTIVGANPNAIKEALDELK